jgi:LPS export ABC transporter protein LptC
MPARGSRSARDRAAAAHRPRFRRFLALAALALMLGGGCGEEPEQPTLAPPGEVPDQVLWDFTTTDSDSGRLAWIFQAEQALLFSKAKRLESRGISVDMYGEDGGLNSTLTADSGLIDQQTGAMTALGDVHVVSAQDYELRTEVLHWDREREIFHTDAYVEVRHGENLYTGYEMECDRNLEHLHIRRDPQGVIVQRGEDGLD